MTFYLNNCAVDIEHDHLVEPPTNAVTVGGQFFCNCLERLTLECTHIKLVFIHFPDHSICISIVSTYRSSPNEVMELNRPVSMDRMSFLFLCGYLEQNGLSELPEQKVDWIKSGF